MQEGACERDLLHAQHTDALQEQKGHGLLLGRTRGPLPQDLPGQVALRADEAPQRKQTQNRQFRKDTQHIYL